MTNNSNKKRIRDLNDAFRQGIFSGGEGIAIGRVYMTRGIFALEAHEQAGIIAKVRAFDQFSEDNDPYAEHDFGTFEHAGQRVLWKIDYYTPDMSAGSVDPSDPTQTLRVLTIMLADEW